jgi:hypothetical protein
MTDEQRRGAAYLIGVDIAQSEFDLPRMKRRWFESMENWEARLKNKVRRIETLGALYAHLMKES